MSQTIRVIHQVLVFTKENAYDVIKEGLETDEDFNGNNGKYYLDDDAAADGCKSNFEYFLKKNWKGDPIKFLDKLFAYLPKHDSYYREIYHEVVTIGDTMVVSIVYKTQI